MSTFVPPLTPGAISALSVNNGNLGCLVQENAIVYRVVKAGAAIVAAAKQLLVTAVNSKGIPTWVVDVTTTADDFLVVGIVPTLVKADLAAGDFFLIQVAGTVKAIAEDVLSAGAIVGAAATAGQINTTVLGADPGVDPDVSDILPGIGSIGVALQAAGAPGATIGVLLKGLI